MRTLATPFPHDPGVLGERAPGALDRFGGEAPGRVDALPEPDDPHLAVHIGEAGRRDDVGDQQANGVGAAVDRGDLLTAASPRSRGNPRHRRCPGRHGQRFVTERIDARALGERMRDQHVQAFDPVGHTAAGNRCTQRLDGVTLGEIRLVGAPVRARQFRVVPQPFGHLPHDTRGLRRLASAVSPGSVR